MGINISVVRIKEITDEELFSGRKIAYINYDRVDWFDYTRYKGDNDFLNENEFETLDKIDSEDGYYFKRPKDFNLVRNWINSNECTKERLLLALDRIENDKDLYFYVSC
ncbi:hypothetical protein [Empedobacter brevis]|uniref:hypothetical protein n=1 Tax=Empedobacter brevis TaxID=247 RepID=UPI0028D025AD|nr:hypothetical protein [Empedobacter brevis]